MNSVKVYKLYDYLKRMIECKSSPFINSHNIYPQLFFSVTASNGPRFFTEYSTINVGGTKKSHWMDTNFCRLVAMFIYLLMKPTIITQHCSNYHVETSTGFTIALACSDRKAVLRHNGRFQTHHSKSFAFVSVASIDPVSRYHLLAFYSLFHKKIKRFLTKSKGCKDKDICYWSTM